MYKHSIILTDYNPVIYNVEQKLIQFCSLIINLTYLIRIHFTVVFPDSLQKSHFSTTKVTIFIYYSSKIS